MNSNNYESEGRDRTDPEDGNNKRLVESKVCLLGQHLKDKEDKGLLGWEKFKKYLEVGATGVDPYILPLHKYEKEFSEKTFDRILTEEIATVMKGVLSKREVEEVKADIKAGRDVRINEDLLAKDHMITRRLTELEKMLKQYIFFLSLSDVKGFLVKLKASSVKYENLQQCFGIVWNTNATLEALYPTKGEKRYERFKKYWGPHLESYVDKSTSENALNTLFYHAMISAINYDDNEDNTDNQGSTGGQGVSRAKSFINVKQGGGTGDVDHIFYDRRKRVLHIFEFKASLASFDRPEREHVPAAVCQGICYVSHFIDDSNGCLAFKPITQLGLDEVPERIFVTAGYFDTRTSNGPRVDFVNWSCEVKINMEKNGLKILFDSHEHDLKQLFEQFFE